MICHKKDFRAIRSWAAIVGMVFLYNSVQSQYFYDYKEYLFVNDYNLALSAFPKPPSKGNSVSPNTNVAAAPANPFGGGAKMPGTNANIPVGSSQINRADLQAAMKPDSVFLAPLNFSDDNQIWIVESNAGLCSNAYFWTIRNKGTGKYLTTQSNCKLNIPAINFSSCTDGRSPIFSLVLQDKYFSPNGCFQDQCMDRFQKWRFAPIEEKMFNRFNNGFERPYPANIVAGRTEFISLKQFEITDGYSCKVSEGHREVMYFPNRTQLYLADRMMLLNSENVISLNSKFRIIPNRPVTLVNLIDYPWFICPTELLKGDRDFSGPPLMEIKCELTLNERRDMIIFNVTFKAEETKPDFSSTRLKWSHPVYFAPPGAKIKQIIGNVVWHNQTRTNINDESFKLLYFSDFIKSCEIIGDTFGDDISTDNNCNDDTRLGNFKFNKVAVIFE